MAKHKYKNAPIVEALCEFTFTPSTKPEAHFLTLPGKLQLALKDDYAGAPREQRVQTISGSPNSDMTLQDALFRVQLPNTDGTRIVSVGANALSVSMLTPYTSWEEDFLPRIEKALTAYMEIASPTNVTRIGVRYINKISIPKEQANPQEYFTAAIPEDTLIKGETTSFAKRFEFKVDGDIKIILTHATLVSEAIEKAEYLLDVDAVSDGQQLTDKKQILEKAAALHSREGEVFEALITDKARKLFDA